MKLPPENLNSGHYPSHPTNIYTCRVTTAPRVCGCNIIYSFKKASLYHIVNNVVQEILMALLNNLNAYKHSLSIIKL